jgi:hypothetical protein
MTPSAMHHGDGAMVITVIAMGMVEMPIDQVVEVIAVRNRLMAAARAMDMFCIMATALMPRRTRIRITLANRNRVLCHSNVFLMAKVALVQVIDMPFVFDLRMPAIGAMLVFVSCG